MVILTAAVTVQVLGLTEPLTDEDRARDLLTESGAWGPVLFVVAFSLTHPVGLPSIALTFVAGLVWPAPLAVALSWIGGMIGTQAGFWGARWLGRDWVESKLSNRWLRVDDWIASRALVTVFLVRLFTYLPPQADWLFGVSRVRWRQFVLGTAAGIVPATVFVVLVGDQALEALGRVGPAVWLGVGAVLGLAAAAAVALRRRAASQEAPAAPALETAAD